MPKVQDGLSRCSSDNFIPFGLMEYGIMPVKDSNHSGVRDVEGELVQLTLPKASTAPEFGVYSRYNVSVHFQEPIEFNISYPFEGFNRTFPVLYTSDVIDGSNFIMQNCNATTFTNDNATFDCPDFGRLCTDMTDNSGYVYTLDGNDYMVNTMSGGKYFLQGIYTSAPTGQPTGQPTGEPTSIPSGEPTGQPTSMPSGKPTTTPSSAPSAAPTSIPTSPTGQPSAEPTGKPSGGPTSQPSRQGPSSRPTSQPTPNPTSIPTMIPTKAIAYAVEVAVSQELRAPGLNSTSFMAADSVKAFKLAVANITAVLPKDVDIESVTDVMSSRRRLLLSRQLQASVIGVSVNYSIELSISDPSNTADINNAVSSVTNSLQTATNTSSGTSAFQTALVQAAQSTGSTLV
ncbi:MAG: PT domain-containing protein, partial [Candidatus Poseidoniales archaeon]